jgi:hypothetical protein
MFPRSTQACRLTARRRLALGGLAVTGALVAGAFVSTPAFADAPVEVSSFSQLQDALTAHDASIKLMQSLDSSSSLNFEEFEVPTTLDLNGSDLTTNGIEVDANAALSVIDSTATADAGSSSTLSVSAPPFGAVTAVQLDAGSTFHVTDVTANIIGAQGGAGIGGAAASASFIADGSAHVSSYGSDDNTHGGGAGIGGTAGQQGIHVTVAGSAQVSGSGGKGAAGVGGGFGAAGGDVHVAGGALQARQGGAVDATAVQASSIGAGENATALGFGGLQIDDGASIALDSDTPLVLPADAVVHNAGGIGMNPGSVDTTGHAVRGAGTIANSGTIDTHDQDGAPVDPDTLIDSSVKVTGNNYRIAVDANGGAITGADGTSRHLLSNSLGDLLGYSYSVAAPSDAVSFQGWNTKSDGTGTDVADLEQGDLSTLGASTDGTPVSATLYAKFVAEAVEAPEPSAPELTDPFRATVKIGHRVRVVLAGASTGAATYRVVSGSLPKGVVLDRSTGVVSGVPTTPGSWFAEIEATNDGGTSSTTVSINVPEVKDLLDTKNHVAPVAVGASKVPLKVAGLKKGEHWTVKVDGKVVEHGTMKKAGTLSVSVHLKKALRDKVHTITIAGSRAVTDRSTRAATTVTVTSLAARKTLKVHTVSANGMKLVAVEKLAAGEHVVVKDGAKVIASGNASEYGIFAFPQSKAGKGTSKLTVHGAAAKRAGKLTVKNPKH